MRATAIRPRHLVERHDAEVGATYITPSVPVVAVDEEAPPRLDLIERISHRFFGTNAGAQMPECCELTFSILAREQVGEDRGEDRATVEQSPAQAVTCRIVEANAHHRYRASLVEDLQRVFPACGEQQVVGEIEAV
jgi:hypothetical protein